MCLGHRMKRNTLLRKGRSSITALSLADLSCAGLRLTDLSIAPLDLEISIRILLLPDKQKAVPRSAQARNKLPIAKQTAAALDIRMIFCMSLGMCIGLRVNMNVGAHAMIVNVSVHANLDSSISICMSLGMRMGHEMNVHMVQRRGRCMNMHMDMNMNTAMHMRMGHEYEKGF